MEDTLSKRAFIGLTLLFFGILLAICSYSLLFYSVNIYYILGVPEGLILAIFSCPFIVIGGYILWTEKGEEEAKELNNRKEKVLKEVRKLREADKVVRKDKGKL